MRLTIYITRIGLIRARWHLVALLAILCTMSFGPAHLSKTPAIIALVVAWGTWFLALGYHLAAWYYLQQLQENDE